MFRVLASRRWALRILAGLVLVAACVRLGMWQLDRNEERAARNAVIEANADRDPVPVDDVLEPGRPLSPDQLWTPVVATGTYDLDRQLVVRLRPLDGRPGVHALIPLVTADGTALLVDRGFVAQDGSASAVPPVPDPPTGEVDVVGRVRASEEGRGTGGDPDSGAIRYVDVDALAAGLPYRVYGAWVEVIRERPDVAEAPLPPPAPTPDAGPHLSYAIQWFLFACIGVGGFVILMRAESRTRREDEATRVAMGDDAGTTTRVTR
ncbi:MAG: SURF1 family cytochrome oxidase biogenesis protein [Jiangellaceae bacterium]